MPAGMRPPAAPRYQTYKKNVQLGPNQSLYFQKGRGYYAGPKRVPRAAAAPPKAPPRAPSQPTQASQAGGLPTDPWQLAQLLTAAQHQNDAFDYNTAVSQAQADRDAALASLQAWGQQIQDTWKNYAGQTQASYQGGIADERAANSNIANLFGESNKAQAMAGLEPNVSLLSNLGQSWNAFSNAEGPILAQQQMDYANQALKQYSAAVQSAAASRQKASGSSQADLIQNYLDIQKQFADQQHAQDVLDSTNAYRGATLDLNRHKFNQQANVEADKSQQAWARIANSQTAQQSLDTYRQQALALRQAGLISTQQYRQEMLAIQRQKLALSKANKTGKGKQTQNQWAIMVGKANDDAKKWFNGRPPKVPAGGYLGKDSKGNETWFNQQGQPLPDQGEAPSNYQDVLNRLKSKYPLLTLEQRQQIANQLYDPGEDGRPFFSLQERLALAKAGVKPSTINAAMYDKKNADQLRHNYGGVLSRAGNPKQGATAPTAKAVSYHGEQFYSPVGTSWTPTTKATHQTEGLPGYPAKDLMAPGGTPVVAPEDGEVIKLSGHDPASGTHGPGDVFGWSVYIRGKSGRVYYMTHLGSRNVAVGTRVRGGQQIATVGNWPGDPGRSHVHFGVNTDGVHAIYT